MSTYRDVLHAVMQRRIRHPNDQTDAERDAGVTPTDYGYAPGSGQRYASLANVFAQLGQSGGHEIKLQRDTTYTISSVIALSGISNFRIDGNGATIKAADGMTVGSGTQLLHLTNCTDFVIENLNFNGNRANRTPAETTSHLCQFTDCQKFTMIGVRADNGTTDGFYFDASDAADHATFCRDFALINCHADNAYRNCASFINCFDAVVIGGSFTGANGISPESGVDVESNTALDPGNRSIRFIGTRFTGCNRYGLVFSSVEGAYGMVAQGCYYSDCDLGGVLIGATAEIIGGTFDGFSSAGAVGVEIQANAAARGRIIGAQFRNFTGSAAACIDDGSTSTLMEVIGCDFDTVVKAVTADGARAVISDCNIAICSDIGISIGSGCQAVVSSNYINAATGRAIFSTGTDGKINNNHCVDVASVSGGYIQAEGAGNVITHNTCEATSAQATTIGIRAHHDATAVAFNKCINLHTTQPYSIQGTESATSAFVGHNVGGTANAAKSLRFASAAPVFSDASRPAATTVPLGAEIWNSTDNAPNYSDGTNWRDAAGTVT